MKCAIVAALAGLAAAHSGIRSMEIDGVTYAPYLAIIDDLLPGVKRIEWTPTRNYFQKSANSPVNDVTDPSIACGVSPQPPRLKAIARAGATVKAGWTDIIPMHVGPALAYMARIDDGKVNRFRPTDFSWFKVYHDGFDAESGLWANERVKASDNTFAFKIPSDIAPGLYTIRTELIALHGNSGPFNLQGVGGSTMGGFQSYVHCFNVQVSGNGTRSPDGVKFPGAYTWDDQGIMFSPGHGPDRAKRIAHNREYTIPGPALYNGTYDAPQGPAPVVSTADKGSYPPDIQAKYQKLADRVYQFSKDGIVELNKWWPTQNEYPTQIGPSFRFWMISAQSIAGILYEAAGLRRDMFAAGYGDTTGVPAPLIP